MASKPKSIQLTALFNAQSGICPYCGDDMTMERGKQKSATIEHIIPKSKGGPDLLYNFMAVCNECNQERGNQPLATYLIIKRRFERGPCGTA